jgi:molecular chaperone IbpA
VERLARPGGQTHIRVAQAIRLRTGLPGFGGRRPGHHCMSLFGGYAMRTFDLTPLYRSTVGFDRLFSLLDNFGGDSAAPTYPPYNIERTGENAYRITVAVAGFTDQEINIEAKENTLTIRGDKNVEDKGDQGEVLYQGIAARAFERRFQLADHVTVQGASLENGLLHVDLVREIPEAKKPRQIPIGKGQEKGKVIEAQAKAA